MGLLVQGGFYMVKLSKYVIGTLHWMGFCLDEEGQSEVGLDKGKMSLLCVGAELEVHTHFPSMMLKSASEMGNAPHPTTRSVGVAAPRRTNSSKRRTIPGRTLGRDGRTVKMLWLN